MGLKDGRGQGVGGGAEREGVDPVDCSGVVQGEGRVEGRAEGSRCGGAGVRWGVWGYRCGLMDVIFDVLGGAAAHADRNIPACQTGDLLEQVLGSGICGGGVACSMYQRRRGWLTSNIN